MARVYTGSGGYVNVTPANLADLLNQIIPAVSVGAQLAAKQSLVDMRENIQGGIRDMSMGLKPLSPATLITRGEGKTSGNFPSRPSRNGIAPLLASGQTVKGIKINGSALSLEIDPSDSITYTRGNMSKVAEKHEDGFTIKGVYTKKMLAYLHILFKKQFGQKARILGQGHTRVGVAYSRTVDPRPAWEIGTKRSIPQITQNFTYFISDELKKKGLI